jgi:hypothetical protein
MQEAYYSYVETKAGKSPAEIRARILKGEWQNIDLNTAASIE